MLTHQSRRHQIALWIGVVLFAAVILTWSWWRWWTFRYTTFDLAFYIQALSEALHGRWQVSLLDVPLLGNHAEPIVFLLLPLFALWPHPILPVLVQTIAVATMPVTAARIARHLGLSSKESLLLALSTLLAPATGWMALHEFHPETFAAPLILAIFDARLRGRQGWYWCWWLLLLACKENLALMQVWWCVVFVWLDRREGWRHQFRWYLAPGAVALLWLLLYAGWLAPWLNGGRVDYLELYSHLGKTKAEVLATFFTDPARLFASLGTSLSSGSLLPGVLLPWCGLAFLRPRWLIIALPVLLQHLLSWRSSEWSIRLHYGAPLLGLAWVAVAEAVARREKKLAWCWAIFAGSALGQIALGPAVQLPGELASLHENLSERRWKADLMDQALKEPTASVTASNGFLPHLAARRELHSLHHVLKGLKTLSRAEYTPPPPTDRVLIDFADNSTFNVASGFYHPQMRTADGRIVPSSDALLHAFLRDGNYESQGTNAVRLFSKGQARTSGVDSQLADLQIARAQFEQKSDGTGTLRVEWNTPAQRKHFPWLALGIADADAFAWLPLGMAAPGMEGRSQTEEWTIVWPHTVPKGRCKLRLWVYDRDPVSNPLGLPSVAAREVKARFDLGEVDIPPHP